MQRYRLIPTEEGIATEIPKTFEGLVKRVTAEAPIVRHLRQGEEPFFVGPRRWGFRGVLRQEAREGVLVFTATFAAKSASATSRSLDVLRLALMLEEWSEEDAPLVAFTGLLAQGGNSGYDVGVTLSGRMVGLVKRFTAEDHGAIALMMKQTMDRVRGDGRLKYPFQSEATTDGRLSLTIPGNATALYCGQFLHIDGSAHMSGHNIDRADQQFALLAGLAQAQTIAERIALST